nr:hypothetical protein [Allomuricauda sp.]
MRHFLAIFFLCSVFYGQDKHEGTIFLSDGQALEGFVSFSTVYAGIQRKNPRVFYWENEEDGKKQTFKAAQVDSVVVKSGIIYAIPVDKPCKKLFFKVLCEGKFPLVVFNMVHAGGPNFGFVTNGSSEYWIWKKNQNKAFPLKTVYSSTTSFKKQVRNYLSECPSLMDGHSLKELRNMEAVELYNLYKACIE